MRTGFFVTARLGSTRLARKHLLEVQGRPLLSFLIERIKKEFEAELEEGSSVIVICTSDCPENRAFERLADQNVTVFYGSNDNIPLRHLQAAEELDVTHIISIDGDDILCSAQGMRQVYGALLEGHEYVCITNLPLGMNSSGYSKIFLEGSVENFKDKKLETGWTWLFDPRKKHIIPIDFPYQHDLLRFTLDYKEDYEFFKRIIEEIGDNIFTISDQELVKYVLKQKLYSITEPIGKIYWHNFHQLQQKEKQISTTY